MYRIGRIPLVFFTLVTVVHAIEVSGHLTEDTIWSPENNPYIVIDNLYVDVGVTLRILPGTIVKLPAAELNDYYDQYRFDWNHNGGNSEAKAIWVSGNIIAEGTAQDSIIFTRYQTLDTYHWGTIHINSLNQDISIFKHCRIEYSFYIVINLIEYPGLSLNNGRFIIEDCVFENVEHGIKIRENLREGIIRNNQFRITDPYSWDLPIPIFIGIGPPEEVEPVPLLIAGNTMVCAINRYGYYGIDVSAQGYPIHIVN